MRSGPILLVLSLASGCAPLGSLATKPAPVRSAGEAQAQALLAAEMKSILPPGTQAIVQSDENGRPAQITGRIVRWDEGAQTLVLADCVIEEPAGLSTPFRRQPPKSITVDELILPIGKIRNLGPAPGSNITLPNWGPQASS